MTVALGVSALLLVLGLMASLSMRMLALSALGLARLSLLVGAATALAFGGASLVLSAVPAAAAGLALYTLLLVAMRELGLSQGMAVRARAPLTDAPRTIPWMSGPEAKNPAPAGISAPDDLDVADLFEQLREELRRGAGGGGGAGSDFAATRALAERFWPVTAEREAGGGPRASSSGCCAS